MKLKTTKKQIKEQAKKLMSVGYCEAQYLLYYCEPFAYSAGTYGWQCDYYNVNGTIISTGYQPIGDNVDYKVRAYEDKARAIVHDPHYDYEMKLEVLYDLLQEFVSKL